MLEQASAGIDPAAAVTFSPWYRVLGWYWFMTGIMLLWIIPKIQFETAWFRFIFVGFMAVGTASLITISQHGPNLHNRYGAAVFEIGIPAATIVWQWFVARDASSADSS